MTKKSASVPAWRAMNSRPFSVISIWWSFSSSAKCIGSSTSGIRLAESCR